MKGSNSSQHFSNQTHSFSDPLARQATAWCSSCSEDWDHQDNAWPSCSDHKEPQTSKKRWVQVTLGTLNGVKDGTFEIYFCFFLAFLCFDPSRFFLKDVVFGFLRHVRLKDLLS